MRDFDAAARDVQGHVSTSSTKYSVIPIHEYDGSILQFPVSSDAVIQHDALEQAREACETLGTVYKTQIDFGRSELKFFVIYSGEIPSCKPSCFKPPDVDLSGVGETDVSVVQDAIEYMFLVSNDGTLPSVDLDIQDEFYNVCATGLRVVNHPLLSRFTNVVYDFANSETRVRVPHSQCDRPNKRQRRG